MRIQTSKNITFAEETLSSQSEACQGQPGKRLCRLEAILWSDETKLEPQYLQRTHTGTGRMCNPHAQTQSFTHSSNKLLLYISGEDSLRLDEASDLFHNVQSLNFIVQWF